MLARKHMHLEMEIIKWMALLAVATALVLVWAKTAYGDENPARTEPGVLPAELIQLAQPIPVRSAVDDDPYSSQAPQLQRDLPPGARYQWSLTVWQAINRLPEMDPNNVEQTNAAISSWADVDLSCETEVWRHLAFAGVYLRSGNLAAAEGVLDTARNLDDDNAVVHYYRGLLRLSQSRQAVDYPDAVRVINVKVGVGTPPQLPFTRSVYERAAVEELERAVELSGQMAKELDRSFVEKSWTMPPAGEVAMPLVSATPRDLLIALDDELYDAKSHLLLGHLYLSRDQLEHAEHHLDRLVDCGDTDMRPGYGTLAKAFAAADRHTDAARVYLKAAARGEGVLSSLNKALDSLGHAFEIDGR